MSGDWRVSLVVGEGASGRGRDAQGGGSRCRHSNCVHRETRVVAVHVALRTQADGVVWTTGFRKDNDVVQCTLEHCQTSR
jgi:hypothetical protein